MSLALEQDVSGGPERFCALGNEPWLRLEGGEAFRSRWIEIRYSSGLFEDPVRPLIRFRLQGGRARTLPMNGASAGSARWIGRVPDTTQSVSISPTNRAGAFGFAVNAIAPISGARIVATGLSRHPGLALTGLGAHLIGSRDEARHCFAFAALGTPLERYREWLGANTRPADLAGIDRTDWTGAPGLRLLMRLDAPVQGVKRTLASLENQSFRDWTLHAMGTASESLAFYRSCKAANPRLTELDESLTLSELFGADDLVACLNPGDTLPETALGAVVSAALRQPASDLLYGDEDCASEDCRPLLKPDYDKYLEEGTSFVGPGAFVRVRNLVHSGWTRPRQALEAEGRWQTAALANPGKVLHVRRIVHRRQTSRAMAMADASTPSLDTWPSVEIIIPTRDRAGLLAACLDGLRNRTDYPPVAISLVDNGSTDDAALALLDRQSSHRGTKVLRCPGPFNYAALCNLAARASGADILVFLNNDIEVVQTDWLKRLCWLADKPDIGAVGAKLLYPDGRIQHAGVVLGLGEMATHLYRGEPDQPGYMNRLTAPHAVAAVTGAVLAVGRSKFEAVGGFDQENFPILYNDTDICLRLRARGWETLLEPRAVLVHRESASRGRPSNPFTLHQEERRVFAERWGALIRDDPYFHPALSLYAYKPALG